MFTSGIVLCGGLSSRMGRPKAWLPFRGAPLLQHVVETVGRVVDSVVVVAAVGQDVPPCNARIIRDEHEQLGPLAGLAAGLKAVQNMSQAVYLSSCDVPLLKSEFVSCVLNELTPDVDIVVPEAGGYKHPLAAAYRVSVLKTVEDLLNARRLRPVYLFDTVPTKVITAETWQLADAESVSLQNANTWEEYVAIIRSLNEPKASETKKTEPEV